MQLERDLRRDKFIVSANNFAFQSRIRLIKVEGEKLADQR
jgi:hypothetical protein